ncbi:MAG: hypothetical protein ACRC5C_13160 [Bacilli bacterium]
MAYLVHPVLGSLLVTILSETETHAVVRYVGDIFYDDHILIKEGTQETVDKKDLIKL